MGIVIVLHLELREEVICREEHPVHDRGGGLSAGSGGIPLGRRGVGSAVPFSSRGGGRGAKVPAADHPTHQWRGDTPEKAMEAFLARDGHQRVQGGAVSGVWRWVLESVFHLMTNGQSEEERKEKKQKKAHRYRKEIRRLDRRCLRRFQRENRVWDRVSSSLLER